MKTIESPTNPHAAGKAAHTAGPWKASGFTIYATPEKRSFGGPEREYLRPVCSMEPGETDGPEYLDWSGGAEYNERLPGDAEAHANARLIAAAPELLEALKAIEGRITKAANAFYVSGKRSDLQAAFDGWKVDAQQARAAIARATGQGGGE